MPTTCEYLCLAHPRFRLIVVQKATGSIERDENYVPRTRSDYKLPPIMAATVADYHEIFEETPAYSLLRILLMQALGWQFYLFTNALGSPMYENKPSLHVRSDRLNDAYS